MIGVTKKALRTILPPFIPAFGLIFEIAEHKWKDGIKGGLGEQDTVKVDQRGSNISDTSSTGTLAFGSSLLCFRSSAKDRDPVTRTIE